MPAGYFTFHQLVTIVGASLQAAMALLVVVISYLEWSRTRRPAYKLLGGAFLVDAVMHAAYALAPSWAAGELGPISRLSVPVWLRFLEGCFLVLLAYSLAVHDRAKAKELRRVTRRLFEMNLVLALSVQVLWYFAARDDSAALFGNFWGERLWVAWHLSLMLLGAYLAWVMQPEIRVGSALSLLAVGKAAYLIHLLFLRGDALWPIVVEWGTGMVASLMLLAAAHLGIVAETFTDALTRLHNRRYFMTRAPLEWDRARRRNSPVSILVMDLDHFKRYNDTEGHVAGDHLLRGVSRVLNRQLRPYDLLARWGGEEFIALLPDTDAETGVTVAERLRLAVAEAYGGPNHRCPVTISIGVAAWPDVEGDWRETIQGADEALYRAKQRRNRVSLFLP